MTLTNVNIYTKSGHRRELKILKMLSKKLPKGEWQEEVKLVEAQK